MNNNWYLIYNGSQVGPMTTEQLAAYNPTPDTMVWQEGMAQWQPIYSIPELMQYVGGHQPINGNIPPQYIRPANAKDKTTAGLLALLIGWLGIQYFYLDKATAGILTIVISIVTCGAWGLVTFIQGILMLTMSDQDFQSKYVNTDSTFPLF